MGAHWRSHRLIASIRPGQSTLARRRSPLLTAPERTWPLPFRSHNRTSPAWPPSTGGLPSARAPAAVLQSVRNSPLTCPNGGNTSRNDANATRWRLHHPRQGAWPARRRPRAGQGLTPQLEAPGTGVVGLSVPGAGSCLGQAMRDDVCGVWIILCVLVVSEVEASRLVRASTGQRHLRNSARHLFLAYWHSRSRARLRLLRRQCLSGCRQSLQSCRGRVLVVLLRKAEGAGSVSLELRRICRVLRSRQSSLEGRGSRHIW